MPLVLVTPPATEPVTLQETKQHLRVDITDDDELIAKYIVAAREYVEGITGRALITQTWDLFLDNCPKGQEINGFLLPLQSVQNITYTGADGATHIWDSANYVVDTTRGRVILGYGKSWPSITLQPANGIKVRFTSGYGSASDVPMPIKHAILLLVGHFYEDREAVVFRAGDARQLPFAVDDLLWPYRVWSW